MILHPYCPPFVYTLASNVNYRPTPPGQYCKLYRAKINEIISHWDIDVLLIDYGHTEIIKYNDVFDATIFLRDSSSQYIWNKF